MKARVVTVSELEIRKQVKKEFDRLKGDVYDSVVKDVVPQFAAVCLCVLHREYGFGAKRMKRFLDSVNAEFEFMGYGVLGKDYSPQDCLNFLKDEYKIDVDKELENSEGGDQSE